MKTCPCGWALPVEVGVSLHVDEDPRAVVEFRCPHCNRKFSGNKAVVVAVDDIPIGGSA